MNIVFILYGFFLIGFSEGFDCPACLKYGKPPPTSCTTPSDPLKKPKSNIEKWLTKETFDDLFQKSNLGWGPSDCRPYNYKTFIIAARYFPRFGNEHVTKDPEGNWLNTNYTSDETYKRDVAAFFSHAIQETGENDIDLYKKLSNKTQADDCFYRGGFFNWFEGGPKSSLVQNFGLDPNDGVLCTDSGKYCDEGTDNKWFYPCANGTSGKFDKGCYFGRGAIQISYNFNYGLLNRFLQTQGIKHNGELIDILKNPNLVMTKTDPPLSMLASLWFYMTPQSPKPAMHDIVIGNWVSPDKEYAGGVFGPTSLVINNECNGEDPTDPGGPGENRRIKAFRWFTNYFKVPFCSGEKKTLSCKEFNKASKSFDFQDGRFVANSWDVNWDTSWNPNNPCTCIMEKYENFIQAFDPKLMPQFSAENARNKLWCEQLYNEGWRNQTCSRFKIDQRNVYNVT